MNSSRYLASEVVAPSCYWDKLAIHLEDASDVEVYRYLEYEENRKLRSNKQPLLFIHGWGLSPQSYRKPLSSLVGKYDVYAPALPGFGKSSPLHAKNFSLQKYAEVINEAWIRYDVSDKVPIVAHSMGCGVAVTLALENFSLVESLTLVCPIGGGGNFTSWPHLVSSLREDANLDLAHYAVDSLPIVLKHPYSSARSAWLAKKANLAEEIQELIDRKVPIRIIFADQDAITPPGAIKDMPGVEYSTVPGTHGWLLKNIDLFQTMIC